MEAMMRRRLRPFWVFLLDEAENSAGVRKWTLCSSPVDAAQLFTKGKT